MDFSFSNAFVTGATGFLGRHLVRQLLARGVQVRALTRTEQGAAQLNAMGATPIVGDLVDPAPWSSALHGCDVLFHTAALTRFDDTLWREAELVQVAATQQLFELALEAGVGRLIYTSDLRIFGDTEGELIEESFQSRKPPQTHYERTKWLAYEDVIRPLQARGAPLIVIFPGTLYGPDDPGLIGQLMERFYFQKLPFPFLLAPSTIFSFTHVEDAAAGHILAAARGKIGERYILAGPAVSLGEMVDFWARLTGKRPPAFHVPAAVVRPFLPAIGRVEKVLPLPEIMGSETLALAGTEVMASAQKAQEELGWTPRALQAGMLDAFAVVASRAAGRPQPVAREREIATIALGTAVLLLGAWLLSRYWRGKEQES